MSLDEEKRRQVDAISNILGKSPESKAPDYRFTFGMHKGRLLEYVVKHHKDYILWCYHNDVELPMKVISYIEDVLLKEESANESKKFKTEKQKVQ